MSQRRLKQMSGLLQSIIVETLLFKSNDARLKEVNVSKVKVTADLKKAIVFYSLFEKDEDFKKDISQALIKAKGFIRSEVAKNVSLKYVPEITFEFDKNLEYAHRLNKIISNLNINPETNPEDMAKEEDDK